MDFIVQYSTYVFMLYNFFENRTVYLDICIYSIYTYLCIFNKDGIYWRVELSKPAIMAF